MKELIRISVRDGGQRVVSARELYEFLEVKEDYGTWMVDGGKKMVSARDLYALMGIKTPYTIWMSRMIGHGFEENVDYQVLEQSNKNVRKGGRLRLEHALTAPMAKEVCMIQNTPASKRVRKYFIACEEALLKLHHRPPTALEIGELYVAGLKREKLLEEDNAQKDQVIEEQKQEAKKKMIEAGQFKEKKDYWIEKSDPSDPKWDFDQK